MDTVALEGTRLAGRYTLGAVLGRGGMADVYDGTDERLGRPVAVKVLRPEMAAHADVRRRFESEALAAARLSHPNVVTVYDTGEDAGRPFIVMERLPGETLADRLAAGPADQAWIRAVAGDVLLALAAAHRAGIIHRDVKPGNILLAPDGCAKVADFGIAKSMEPLAPGGDATAAHLLLGTPAYVAPERLEGKPATPQADLYSLGVVLYVALAGRKPVPGTSPLAVAKAVQDGSVAPLETVRPDVDPTLAAVVRRAMAPRPEDRYSSADEMRAALEGDLTVVGAAPWMGAPQGAEQTQLLAAVGAPVGAAELAGEPLDDWVGGPAAAGTAPGAAGGWRAVVGHRLFLPLALAALLLVGLAVIVTTMSGSSSPAGPTSSTTVAPAPATATTVAPPVAPTTVPAAPTPAPKPKGHDKKGG